MTFHVPEECRITEGVLASTVRQGNNGAFLWTEQSTGRVLRAIASDGAGWEHVSVSFVDRCPTWEEMVFIKTQFWDDEDAVMQIIPPTDEYVNHHPYTLHLWRPVGGNTFPRPPSELVGGGKPNKRH